MNDYFNYIAGAWGVCALVLTALTLSSVIAWWRTKE